MTCLHPRPCEPSGEARSRRGGQGGSIVLGLALSALAVILAAAVGFVGAAVSAQGQASSAADAAALAAAPVTFAPFGATGSPAAEAARFASMNGARLERCRCRIDPSFDSRTVTVTVSRSLQLPWLGWLSFQATSSATFVPTALLP